jgi:hypothetical protein
MSTAIYELNYSQTMISTITVVRLFFSIFYDTLRMRAGASRRSLSRSQAV